MQPTASFRSGAGRRQQHLRRAEHVRCAAAGGAQRKSSEQGPSHRCSGGKVRVAWMPLSAPSLQRGGAGAGRGKRLARREFPRGSVVRSSVQRTKIKRGDTAGLQEGGREDQRTAARQEG